MGYLGFVVIVAAAGLIIFLLWHWNYRASMGRYSGFGRNRKNGLPEDPIPPFKRTVSGPSEEELKHQQFDQKLEAWQKSFEARRLRFHTNNVDSLKGTKYTFVPRTRTGEPISNSA